MKERILVAEARRPQREMLDDRARGLPVDEVAIRQRVFEHSDDGVCVVCGLGPNILEDERERLQTTRPDVELGRTVLVQDRRDTRERYSTTVSVHCTQKMRGEI